MNNSGLFVPVFPYQLFRSCLFCLCFFISDFSRMSFLSLFSHISFSAAVFVPVLPVSFFRICFLFRRIPVRRGYCIAAIKPYFSAMTSCSQICMNKLRAAPLLRALANVRKTGYASISVFAAACSLFIHNSFKVNLRCAIISKWKKQEILSQYEAGVTIYGGAASAAHPSRPWLKDRMASP